MHRVDLNLVLMSEVEEKYKGEKFNDFSRLDQPIKKIKPLIKGF